MKVYELNHESDTYQAIRAHTIADFERFLLFDGAPIGKAWVPVSVKLFREATSFQHERPGDFPYLTAGVPVFTPKSLNALADLLEPHGEILPLQSDDGLFFAYNVTRVIDCLDVDNSQVKRFSDGDIMHVQQYTFFPERITGIPIFKIPQLSRAYVFVTAEFLRRVEDHALSGFRFKPLWSSPQRQD